MRLYEHERIQSSCHLALSLSLSRLCLHEGSGGGGEKEGGKEEGEREGGSKAKAIINIIIIITIIIVIGFVLCAISLYLMELMV